MRRGTREAAAVVALGALLAGSVRAQEAAVTPAPAEVPEPTEANIDPTGGVAEPSAVTTVTTTTVPYGVPGPGTDINAGLPSSARPITAGSSARDGFALTAGGSPGIVRGGANAEGIIVTSASPVPSLHTVKKGDTLWDICDQYYKNPWKWPEVWSYNPQLQNPHWIYPGDQLRLRPGGGGGGPAAAASRAGARGGGVAPGTVFLRNQGYIGDPERDVWGTVAGGDDEVQLFSAGMRIYVILRPGVEVSPGQVLTLFVPRRDVRQVEGSRHPQGKIVEIVGTFRVDEFNQKTRVAAGEIVEALNLVERGASVGPGTERIDVVSPRPSEVDLWAVLVDSFYPNVLYGGHQVVFIDKGSEDGLRPGNRLFVIRRGDTWRNSMKLTKRIGRQRMRVEDPDWVRSEPIPILGEDSDFPDEVVAELRVIRTQKRTSVALVMESKLELELGDRALARVGY